MRRLISSGTPYERQYGYSRAVVSGPWIFVAGTTGVEPGKNEGDIGGQVDTAIGRIQAALQQAGAGLQHVVRWRLFVADMTRWQEAAEAMGRHFGAIRPAGTLVGTTALVHPDMLVEIEVDALVDG